MKREAEFLFSAAMLRRTPRSGLQFLGSGRESVAEHVFQTMMAAYVLARLEAGRGRKINQEKLLQLCLMHDLLEARTGDHNYVNKKYVQVDEAKALRDLCDGLSFADELSGLVEEFEARQTPEARLAADADQLALMVLLKEEHDLGNQYARKWLAVARQRLLTDSARELAASLEATDWASWWFDRDGQQWWVNGNKNGGEK